MDRPKELNFVTSSRHKLYETLVVLQGAVTLKSRGDVDVPELQGSIEEIAIAKAKAAAEAVNGPVLTEDTALEFRALKGLPGPYIKHFLTSIGLDGLNNLLAAYEDKTIFAVCTFGFCGGPGQNVILFQGRTQGQLVPARGPPNFGWDPVFLHEPTGKTYAEMDKTEKSEISHRGKALEKLKNWLAGGEPEVVRV